MFAYFIEYYRRYLDDIWLMWRLEWLQSLGVIAEVMDNIDPKIKFTFETSKNSNDNSIPFLDVRISASQGQIQTDMYAKPTDTFNYTPFNSAHPRHVLRNIPYNLARRVKGIVSNEEMLSTRMEELARRLRVKKYPRRLIDDAISSAMSIERKSILYPEPNNEVTDRKNCPKSVFSVTNFDPNIQHPSKLMNGFLTSFNNTRQEEKDKLKVNYSFRRCPSLKQLLMFRKPPNSCKVTKCRGGCIICKNHIHTGSTLKLKTGVELRTNANFQCLSRNSIYIVVCDGCKEFYVGETGDTLRNRFTVHRQQSQEGALYLPVKADQHLRICGRNKYKVFPFFKPKKNTIIYRRMQEDRWIAILKPKLNAL